MSERVIMPFSWLAATIELLDQNPQFACIETLRKTIAKRVRAMTVIASGTTSSEAIIQYDGCTLGTLKIAKDLAQSGIPFGTIEEILLQGNRNLVSTYLNSHPDDQDKPVTSGQFSNFLAGQL